MTIEIKELRSRVQAIEAYLSACESWPWGYDVDDSNHQLKCTLWHGDIDEIVLGTTVYPSAIENAEFIVNARRDLPFLCAAIRELLQVIDGQSKQ